jgi:multiple sugar transport system ATP-binding protein
VDAKLRFEMRIELPRLLRQSGATVLYVTQDYKEAMALGDRIAVLADGKFVQIATPEEIYLKPANLNIASLFGDPSINTVDTVVELTGKTVNIDLGGVKIPISNGCKPYVGRAVTFGVRPESVELGGPKSPGIGATVMAVTPLNERIVLFLKSESGWEFLASLPSSASNIPKSGTHVKASFAATSTHLFDKITGERLHG